MLMYHFFFLIASLTILFYFQKNSFSSKTHSTQKRIIVYKERLQKILNIKSIKMDKDYNLNEQIEKPKFQSFGSSPNTNNEFYALDEPVIDTIKRDLNNVLDKIKVTMSGEGDYEKIRKEWDMWGPLCITLFTASLCAFSTGGSAQQAFTNLFIGMWIGPLMITINANLLGAKLPLLQTVCFIIYCSAPIAALALLVFIMNFIIGSFFINLVIAVGALMFTLRSNEAYFRSLVTGQRQMLNLYPVLLFYVFICLFIAMI